MRKYLTISVIIVLFLISLGLSLPFYDANAQANLRTPQVRIGVGTGTTTISVATSTFSGGIRATSSAITGSGPGGTEPHIVIGNTATTTLYGNSATSTFAWGATFAGGGLFTSNGITMTGGSLLITSTATSTISGGLQLTGAANICLASGICLEDIVGGGITDLNGLTGTVQTFTAQGPLLIGSAGTVHTFIASSSPSFGEVRASTTLAVATTTLGSGIVFGVHGGALIAGTTTVAGIRATGTIETQQFRVSGTATSTFLGGILANGTGNFTTGLMLGGTLNNTFVGTSSFSGGLTLSGLTSTGHGLFSGRGGFGTTTMDSILGIQGGSQFLLMVASSTATVSTGLNALTLDSSGVLRVSGATTTGASLIVRGSAYSQEHALTAAATMNIDWSKANQQVVTLTATTTISAFLNGQNGGAYRLVICQDSVGGRGISWPATSTVVWRGGTSPPFGTQLPDRCDVFSFIGTAASTSVAGMTGTASTTRYLGIGTLNF